MDEKESSQLFQRYEIEKGLRAVWMRRRSRTRILTDFCLTCDIRLSVTSDNWLKLIKGAFVKIS